MFDIHLACLTFYLYLLESEQKRSAETVQGTVHIDSDNMAIQLYNRQLSKPDQLGKNNSDSTELVQGMVSADLKPNGHGQQCHLEDSGSLALSLDSTQQERETKTGKKSMLLTPELPKHRKELANEMQERLPPDE